LLVEPVYKDYWEIVGGCVEANESPRPGAAREVKEELGQTVVPGRLLVVDWVPPGGTVPRDSCSFTTAAPSMS
jgi:8-oxo-dGTP diphosphatase